MNTELSFAQKARVISLLALVTWMSLYGFYSAMRDIFVIVLN